MNFFFQFLFIFDNESLIMNCRNTIWPDGKRTNQTVSRDDNTKLRTRMAAKVALFTLLAGNQSAGK